jgi:hypothetical protein
MSIREGLARIERLRTAYMDGTRTKPMRKEIKSWNMLLKGNPNRLSSGRKSVFKRAHEFAVTILNKLGSEVLLLVLSSLNRTRIAAFPKKEQFLKALRKWWKRVRHPPALKVAAECFIMGIGDDEVDDEEVDDEEVDDEEVDDEEVDDEEVDDEEVDDEEVDTTTPKIMELGKSTVKHYNLALIEENLTLPAHGIKLLAQDIPGLHDRNLWIASGQIHLHALEKLTSGVQENWATMSDRDAITKYLRGSLFEGIQESYMAKLGDTQTNLAVRLRLASGEHEDFILELWLGSLYGSSFSESLRTMASVEDWKPLLGEFLCTAMLTSRLRTTEEGTGVIRSSAVEISSPLGSSFDYRLRVAMRFKEGAEFWTVCYPP